MDAASSGSHGRSNKKLGKGSCKASRGCKRSTKGDVTPDHRQEIPSVTVAGTARGTEVQRAWLPSLTGLEQRFVCEETEHHGLASLAAGAGANSVIAAPECTLDSCVRQYLWRVCARALGVQLTAWTADCAQHAVAAPTSVAVILDEGSRAALRAFAARGFKGGVPAGWHESCESMVVCLGSLSRPRAEAGQRPISSALRAELAALSDGQQCELQVVSAGRARAALAVGVRGCASSSRTPHVVLACAPGARPSAAGLIKRWEELRASQQFVIRGVLRHCGGSSAKSAPTESQVVHPVPKKIPEERRAALLKAVADFVESPEQHIAFSPSVTGPERSLLLKESERRGCTSQSYAFGQGSERVLCLFKGTRFREGCLADMSDPLESEGPDAQPAAVVSGNHGAMGSEVNELLAAAAPPRPRGRHGGGRRRVSSSEFSAEGCGAASSSGAPPPAEPAEEAVSTWQDSRAPAVEIAVGGAFAGLALPTVVLAARACRCWRGLAGRAQIELPPPQVDAALQFCLLEVLCSFDDSRLPLPLSAVYSDMCLVARKASSCAASCARLESSALRLLGPKWRREQLQLLQDCRPHHVAWWRACSDLRRSGFKTLEKMGRHFDAEQLIEVSVQRWQKRIHHSFNTRSCREWALTMVHRQHPLFLEHSAWRRSLAVGPQ